MRQSFNPRTHTGCDLFRKDIERIPPVSIHAPTRGATFVLVHPQKWQNVSIHAPTRGATQFRQCVLKLMERFNPRTHTGCDAGDGDTFQVWDGFNPRTHTGCDNKYEAYHVQRKGFNPRTHTGCDVMLKIRRSRLLCFNPRTHTGCDQLDRMQYGASFVSIHAPTRGATPTYINRQSGWD